MQKCDIVSSVMENHEKHIIIGYGYWVMFDWFGAQVLLKKAATQVSLADPVAPYFVSLLFLDGS